MQIYVGKDMVLYKSRNLYPPGMLPRSELKATELFTIDIELSYHIYLFLKTIGKEIILLSILTHQE